MEPNTIFAPNKTKKTSTMKKVFAILAVAGLMTACSNGEKTEAAADTTKAATVDTTKATTVDTAAAKVDTAAKKVDTAAKKM